MSVEIGKGYPEPPFRRQSQEQQCAISTYR